MAALPLLFGGAALAGAAIEPHGEDPTARTAEPEGHMSVGADTAHAPDPVRGLAVAEDDLRVVVEQPELRRGRTESLRFRIVDEHGQADPRLRRHAREAHAPDPRPPRPHRLPAPAPRAAADGTWSADVRLDAAGSYRLFADFSHDGTARTLAADLRVDGAADLRPLPAPQPTAVSDGGYDVRLDAGRGASRARRPTCASRSPATACRCKTEPYLGAGGHLVALREGDMAFLHVHPMDDGVRFAATFPTAGRYRLFLQFKHEGRVQTVAFTQVVS